MTQAESDMQGAQRELLTFAAKAIGFDLHVNQAGATQLWKNGTYVRFWDPLAYDGDAFRLAIKLSFEIIVELDIGAVTAGIIDGWWKEERFDSEEDAPAATRMAIVRAAATIGESTP